MIKNQDKTVSSIKYFINEDLILKRFKNIEDLKDTLNYFFYGCIDEETGDHLRVKAIAEKSYYDNDFQDYEIIAAIGTEKEDIYDITIYYAKTRINDFIIVETSYEEV